MIFITNAVVDVWRSSYNSGTGVSAAPALVPSLRSIPVFIRDVSTQLALEGVAPGFTLILSCDPSYAIRDGDQIRGYNPWGYITPPILVVQHAGYKSGLVLSHLEATLKALIPNG